MAYIIEPNTRFYVVAYDGIDPLTRRERHRWHPAGRSRADAEAIATTLDTESLPAPDVSTSPLTFGKFLTGQWRARQLDSITGLGTHPSPGSLAENLLTIAHRAAERM